MPINDPDLVRRQCAREGNLRARQSLYEGATGLHPWTVLWEALVELAPTRVVEVGGGVTNSTAHFAELRSLIEYPRGYEETFSRENGDEYLGRHFKRVERRDADIVVTVHAREKLVSYRDSLSIADLTRPVPEDVVLPFIVDGRSSVFLATK